MESETRKEEKQIQSGVFLSQPQFHKITAGSTNRKICNAQDGSNCCCLSVIYCLLLAQLLTLGYSLLPTSDSTGPSRWVLGKPEPQNVRSSQTWTVELLGCLPQGSWWRHYQRATFVLRGGRQKLGGKED